MNDSNEAGAPEPGFLSPACAEESDQPDLNSLRPHGFSGTLL